MEMVYFLQNDNKMIIKMNGANHAESPESPERRLTPGKVETSPMLMWGINPTLTGKAYPRTAVRVQTWSSVSLFLCVL